ncbi:MAG TPA: hypothetical protein VN843_04590, partial [Anaerolineales bacterium]|nr:hypothetical protein [Anaerolineales bacterium]
MMKKSLHVSLALMAILVLVVSACAPAAEAPTAQAEAPATEMPATEAPATEAPASEIGSPEHPIKVLFVPSVDANVIVTGGDVMAQALNEATGFTF